MLPTVKVSNDITPAVLVQWSFKTKGVKTSKTADYSIKTFGQYDKIEEISLTNRTTL